MRKAAERNEKPSIGLTSWYVNPHRVLELIGPDEEYQSVIATSGNVLGKLRLMSETASRLLAWLRKTAVPSLEALLLEGKLAKGKIFTYDGRFFSRGLGGDTLPEKGLKGVVRLRLPLREFGDSRQLFLEFHRDGLTTSTARAKLMGQPSVFVLGYIDSITDSAVIARPYIIADLVEHFGDARFRYRDQLQVPLDDFDAFQPVDFTKPVSKHQLESLKSIPERLVKAAFANLFGEQAVQKDWGGEQSDLFTANLVIDNIRQTGAFLLKGPAKFKPMEISDCGKKADQIIRLFEVGADVSILQHCHTILPPVRKMMAACARSNLNVRCRYGIIDGYDTFRILSQMNLLSERSGPHAQNAPA